MNTIKISVRGPAGSGKTTVAYIIASALKEQGFGVENMDDDEIDSVTEDTIRTRKQSLRPLTNIEIRSDRV